MAQGSDLGATFVPGGWDDYYMPEVVAPSPQRVTPQVPQNMQDDLQRMELEAREPEAARRVESTPDPALSRDPSLSTFTRPLSPPDMQKQLQPDDGPGSYRSTASTPGDLAPSFSPFPKVKGDNIPPSDDEKESVLWNARKHVMSSQNVSVQVTWARDVLSWVEVAMESAVRTNPDQPRSSTPRIEHELRVDAVNIITYLAGQEHPQALYLRSKWLEFGKFGHRVDKREAYTGYKRASELGYARAEYRMGMLFEQSNDPSKAKEHYYRGMSLKDSASMYRLGMMSLLGQLGETRDYQTGLDRIQAAADGADEDAPQGAFVYGMLIGRELPDIYVPDSMLPQDPQKALVYVEKAAFLGLSKAQFKMGQVYELCQLGCEFNPSYSLHYYGLAANQGNAEAALGVSRWFLFGYEGVFKKNEEFAFKYARQASDQKLATGEFAMGYYCEVGIYVDKDLNEARKWYRLAADHGNKDAIGRLESLSEDRTLSKQDHETTTLTRIKSQYGSQRGKRPDRFKQPNAMPTLNESAPPAAPAPAPVVVSEHIDYPDPSRPLSGSERPPAFNVRLDPQPAPQARPQSTAPYPVDERPRPTGPSRPKSAAPYPDDDMPGRVQPSLRPHPGAGPPADRPGSAFGVNTQGLPSRPLPGSRSGNLQPNPPYQDPRGRVVSAGGPINRRPSPGPPGIPPHGRDPGHGRPVSSAPYSNKPLPGSIPPAGSTPARIYDARLPNQSPAPGGPDPRLSAMPPPPPQQQQRQSRIPADAGWSSSMSPPPAPGVAGSGRVGSAPPSQRPEPRPSPGPSPAPTTASAPAAKPSKGPATFEDMGIPQGKQDSDCVLM